MSAPQMSDDDLDDFDDLDNYAIKSDFWDEILCFLYCFAPINMILGLIFLIIGINTPPNPTVSLLSLTTATDTVATYATTPTGGSFTAQNLTAVFSISSRNKAAVIYSHLQISGSQHGFRYRGSRPFISAAATTASVRSVVQSGLSNDTVEFRLPNATVVIESWIGVGTGFSVLDLGLNLRARYVGRSLSVPMRTDCSATKDLVAEIVLNGQDSPQLHFTGIRLDCVVSGDWDGLLSFSYFLLAFSVAVGIGIGIVMICAHYI